MNLPYAGRRYYDSLLVYFRGSYGHYWSSTPNGANNARFMYFYGGGIDWKYSDFRSMGYSIRCFKNDTTPPTITITTQPSE